MEIVSLWVIPTQHVNASAGAIILCGGGKFSVGDKPKFLDATDVFLADLVVF